MDWGAVVGCRRDGRYMALRKKGIYGTGYSMHSFI
jgi:hypothetical protein